MTVKGGLTRTGDPEEVTHVPLDGYTAVMEYAVKTAEVLELLTISNQSSA